MIKLWQNNTSPSFLSQTSYHCFNLVSTCVEGYMIWGKSVVNLIAWFAGDLWDRNLKFQLAAGLSLFDHCVWLIALPSMLSPKRKAGWKQQFVNNLANTTIITVHQEVQRQRFSPWNSWKLLTGIFNLSRNFEWNCERWDLRLMLPRPRERD